MREAWHVLEPNSSYSHGWHIDAIYTHLEAISAGRINRLLINVPPGMMKSLLVSVFWPAWEWGPQGRASLRYLASSYSQNYVKRDSRRMRDLLASEWYQGLWGDKVKLVRAGELSFANEATGFREGVPFPSLTGGRGDRVIVDDPHSTETAESEAERARTARIFRELVPTRLNDPATSRNRDNHAAAACQRRIGYRPVAEAWLRPPLPADGVRDFPTVRDQYRL